MGREKVPPELEWQFDALDLRPVERWLSTFGTTLFEEDGERALTASAQPAQRIVDSYLDTDDWRMARAGFAVRARRRGRDGEITLTATRTAAGDPRQQLEVTEKLSGHGVDALGPEGPVGRRVHAVTGRRPLHPVLQARTRRRCFSLHVGAEEAAEIVLDDTLLVVGQGQRPMRLPRVEVVLRPQWAGALRPIVAQFQASCGLQPATLSPFEAGLLALGVVIPGPADLGTTDIGPDSTMGELAYAVLRRQLAVLRATEPGTRLGEDPEELHDMRVATRRLRAALDLFVDVLPVRARAFRAELGWLAGVLGVVRDLDVQLQSHTAMTEPGQAGSLGGADGPAPGGARRPLGARCSPRSTPCALNGSCAGWPPWSSRVRCAGRRLSASRHGSRCPTSSTPAMARWSRQPAGPGVPVKRPTSTVFESGASACATHSSSVPSSTAGARTASPGS